MHAPACCRACLQPPPTGPPRVPQLYHYLAGLRHFYWDHYKYGKQVDKDSPLEVPAVENSSKLVIGGSAVLAGLAAVM
jgi:succinate dehydrogenase/fumarate reductase cytochrome b subunit